MALTGLVAANNLGDVVDIERTWDNIGNNISASVFIPSPTLDLNFASNKSLVDNVSGQNLITFTRPSTGTFVGSNGLIQTAASGVPRFDHNPATGESLGLLVEEARTNLALNSEALNVWGNNGGAITVSANSQIAPNGSTTADVLSQSAVAGPGRWVSSNSVTYNAGVFYTFSVWLKKISGTDAQPGINLWAEGVGLQSVGVLTAQWVRYTATFLAASTSTNFTGLSIGWNEAGIANNFRFAAWGFQVEAGSFPTSYIPTSGSQATRVADTVSIAGANFSSWHNASQGTFFANYKRGAGFRMGIVTSTTNELASASIADERGSRGFTARNFSAELFDSATVAIGANVRQIGAYNTAPQQTLLCVNGRTVISANTYLGSATGISIGGTQNSYYLALNSQIARIAYYPVRLSNITLQTLTTSGPVSSFPYSFSIKGRDILALKEVNKTSTRDFILTKGLISRAQPRITTASQYTSSGVALRDAAMLKFAPVTRGNYLFSSGLTLSGATVQINGTNARSIATSPFTGSGATVPLLFAGLRPQTNWRISETMASGVVASPESAIPIETSDFLLFMKAGQS